MATKRKQAKTYYEDGVALVALKPGQLYSARVRMDPDAHLGGPHKTWYWSKSKKIKAPSKAKALVEAERYRKELAEGDGGVNMTVAVFARRWEEEREVQARATQRSTVIAKPSFRAIDRDEAEIRRIERLFPDVKVCDLTPGYIEKIITRMRKDGATEQTIFKMFKKLRQIMKRPAITGHIDFNPCDLVGNISEPAVNPVTKERRRIGEDEAEEFIAWLSDQELNGRIVALWLGLTEHIRLGEALALRACDVDFDNDAIYIRETLNKKGEIVPAKAGSERALAMGSFLKGLLLAWFEIQRAEFPHLVKKWRREKIPCGREWDETAPVCSSYYGTHMNADNFGKWMRALMVERGLGEYTTHIEWTDSRGITRVKHGGYAGPSYKSLRSFGATYLVGANVDVKTAQAHFGHRRSSTTLEMYAESVPEHEREVARTMDSFVKGALGGKAPEERSLEAFREAVTSMRPEEWPDWVREIAMLASKKNTVEETQATQDPL